jgi:hypothetical protein
LDYIPAIDSYCRDRISGASLKKAFKATMRWGFNIEVHYNVDASRRNPHIMEDWARNLSEEIKNKRLKKEKEKECFLEERKIKAAQGQKLWEELKCDFQDSIKLLNMEVGEEFLIWEVVRSNELQIRRRNDPHALRGNYDQPLDSISFQSTCLSKPMGYKVQLSGSESATLVSAEEGWQYSPKEVAQNVLASFCRAQ